MLGGVLFLSARATGFCQKLPLTKMTDVKESLDNIHVVKDSEIQQDLSISCMPTDLNLNQKTSMCRCRLYARLMSSG